MVRPWGGKQTPSVGKCFHVREIKPLQSPRTPTPAQVSGYTHTGDVPTKHLRPAPRLSPDRGRETAAAARFSCSSRGARQTRRQAGRQLCVCVCVCVMAMVRAVRGAGEQWEITLTGPVLYIILGADAIHECWLDSTGGLITFCLDAVGVCGLSLTGAVCTVFKKMENFSLFFGQKITF